MRSFFAFSRRDRNGLMLMLVFMALFFLIIKVCALRSDRERRKQEAYLVSVGRFLAASQVEEVCFQRGNTSSLLENHPFMAPSLPHVISPARDSLWVELNGADSQQLVKLPGVGPVFASRIVKYRKMLGGFSTIAQLEEVYGFGRERLAKLEGLVCVDTALLVPLPINNADFKTVLRHPYLDYEQTKKIFSARRSAPFRHLKDMKERTALSDSLMESCL